MNDMQILTFGVAISFIAFGGAYVFLRERYLARTQTAKVRVRAQHSRGERSRRLRRVA